MNFAFVICSIACTLILIQVFFKLKFKHKIHSNRALGTILLGIIPGVYVALKRNNWIDDTGLVFKLSPTGFGLIIFSIGVLVIVMNKSVKKNIADVSQGHLTLLKSTNYWLKNIISWGVYLFAYEYLFRGILFLGLIPEIGTWPAAFVSSLIYVAAHFGAPKQEILGSIFIAPIFVLVTWIDKSVLAAYLLHLIIPLLQDFIFLHNAKHMKLT